MGIIYKGGVELSDTISLKAARPIVEDMVVDNYNDLFDNSVIKAYIGKTVVVASNINGENDGSYILFINDSSTPVAMARMYLYDTNKEKCSPTFENGVITEPGISHSYGWKKLGEGSGSVDLSNITCICGGDSKTSGTEITDDGSTGLTIDNYTLKTNGDGEEDTGDENIIYVAQTDGGTWDKTE